MSKVKTIVRKLRSNGKGLKGTFDNMYHHAEKLIPMVEILSKNGEDLGFAEWVQGHNVHEFITVEGVRYTLRGFIKDNAYHGIRLALRVSRSYEERLIDITTVSQCYRLLEIMRMLAEPAKGEDSGVMLSKQN